MLYAFITMSATYASSAYSSGTRAIAADFGVGTQTATLGTTLFLFGFGVGPLLWAPLSEGSCTSRLLRTFTEGGDL